MKRQNNKNMKKEVDLAKTVGRGYGQVNSGMTSTSIAQLKVAEAQKVEYNGSEHYLQNVTIPLGKHLGIASYW